MSGDTLFIPTPAHLTGNILCAVDVETSGLIVGEHELIEIALIPLGANWRPNRDFRIFELLVRPEGDPDPQLTRTMKETFVKAKLNGLERWAAVGYMQKWFESLKLAPGKKIIPVGCNYVFDRDFIREFLGGSLSYWDMFRDDYRDVQLLARGMGDLCEINGEMPLYHSYKLEDLAKKLKVENLKGHTALNDAFVTAEVYRQLLRNAKWYKKAGLEELAKGV